MKILALDVATKTGWSLSDGNKVIASGVWDFSVKKDESGGLKLLRFRSKLSELHEMEKPDVVVFERSAGKFVRPIINQSELHGTLKIFCEDNKIQYKAYSAGEIKKHVTGKGNANKKAVIKAVQDLGYSPRDDNEADAIAMNLLAMDEFEQIL